MADTKTTALTAATSWASGDLLYMVSDPAGTPASRKITLDNVLSKIVCAANAKAIGVTGYSLTGSDASSMIDLAGTWNTTGTPTLIKANVTDTASNAASLLMDLQVGGTSKFSVTKSGRIAAGRGYAYAQPQFYDSSIGSGAGFQIQSSSACVIYGNSTALFAVDSTASNGIRINRETTIGWVNGHAIADVPDLLLLRDAANTLALRNGANAQAFNVYNTYTSGSVYERGFVRWVSNVLEIGTEHTGASARALAFKINNTTRLTISTTGNLAATNNGYFGAPQTTNWWSSSKVLQVGHAALFNNGSSVTSAMSLSSNLQSTGGGPLYISNGFAAKYDQDSGQHIWYTAPSGAADGAVTFTERMRLTNGGLLEIDKTTEDAGFINFKATADADATSAISTLTTSGTVTHHIQVQINGVTAWIPCSTTDPS